MLKGELKMPRFFVENPNKQIITLSKEASNHISKSLRMKIGENVTICDGNSNDYLCKITKIMPDEVVLKVNACVKNASEPTIRVHLYQALSKGAKFEYIIQKAVELGVSEITPVLTKRCISRPKEKNIYSRIARYQKISKQASQQSGRGKIPIVNPILSFEEAILQMKNAKLNILFYECGGEKLNNIDIYKYNDISFMIGSEGGFEIDEVEFAKKKGVLIGSLGKRILRCETASLCVLSVLMYSTKNL